MRSLRRPALFLLFALLLPLAGPVLAQAPIPAGETPAPAPAIAPLPTIVILVRHAEKAPEKSDAPGDPDLSVLGAARAEALAKAIGNLPVSGIVTTQLKRTGQTAAPFAAAHGLTPEVVRIEKGESIPAHAAKVADAVRKYGGGIVLVVGHSNTVPPIIAALGGPKLPDLPDAEYGNLFLLVPNPSGGEAQLTQSKYGEPEGPPAAAAPATSAAPEADSPPVAWHQLENAKLGFRIALPVFPPQLEKALQVTEGATSLPRQAEVRIQNYMDPKVKEGEAASLGQGQFWVEVRTYDDVTERTMELQTLCAGEAAPLEKNGKGAWCTYKPLNPGGEKGATHIGWVAKGGKIYSASINARQLGAGVAEKIFQSLQPL